MNSFDRIIGYTAEKQELIRIADTLKNWEAYRALGASSPRGLLLHGEPGVGKSLMAKCLIDASGRAAFTCRKTEPNGEFVKTIKETFDRAAGNAPSIIFLDDMDKFANDDSGHRDSEEFVTVQSCIDEAKDKEVFVLATANDIDKLPRSLVRAGRFDRTIEVEAPEEKDAAEIIRHYLSQKKLAEGLDPETIADVLSGRSCATLETVINEASLLAGYQCTACVTMEHIMEASLCIEYGLKPGSHSPIDPDTDSPDARMVWHEAGHAAAAELLAPGSVSLVIARSGGGARTGMTKVRGKEERWNLCRTEQDILVSLAGRAAIELRFGAFDVGASRDLDDAFEAVARLVRDHCFVGFGLYSHGYREDSPTLSARYETVIAAEVERYFRQARELLFKNRPFFEAIACLLAKKGVLATADIRGIRERLSV